MNPQRVMIVLSLLFLGLAMLACDVTPLVAPIQSTPTEAALGQPPRGGAILPTTASTSSATALPTAKAADLSTATPLPQPTAAPAVRVTALPTDRAPAAPATSTKIAPPTVKPVAPVATPDPKLLVVTEADIARAVMGGAGAQQGMSAQGLRVRFADSKMTVSADQLVLGPLQVQNLVMVGRLTAQAGQLRFETESVSPRGMITALLPTVANQALTQFASQWYVEEVRMTDGRLELRIR